MDFAVCPSCKQSVIDDDAVDCPFCGASMKAKPGTKAAPAAPAAAVAAKPAAAAAAKPAVGKPVPGKPTLPGDDFPFEVELTAGKAAIQAMPNPTKQRSLKVVCKMCDTAGYVPPSAAGQDVRCANPTCVMPVFTAPLPKRVEAAPPPPPPKSSNLPFLIIATLLLMGTVLGGIYFVFSQPGGSGSGGKQLSDEDKKIMLEAFGGPKNKTEVKPSPGKKEVPAEAKKEAEVAAPGKKSLDKDALIKSALTQMKDSCLEKVAQRSKAYCRQLSAEACAVTGQQAAFRDHLEQLLKVQKEVSYYRIIPLLDLFWVDMSAGNKKGSAASLESALSEVPNIPKYGRTRLEFVGRLMVALVASDRQDEALKLLSDFQASDADGQLAARLQIAFDGRIAPLSDRFSVLPWKHPQAVAVTASLINRGQMEKALKWASSQSSEEAKAECLGYWAEEISANNAKAGTSDVNGAIAAAVSSLPPTLSSRVWSRAGCGRMQAGDETGVLAAIKLAKEKLDEIKKPAECKMPPVKQTIDFKLPAAGPLIQAATAAAELTNLQAQLAQTKPDAENSLDLVLSFLDAIAPSSAVAQQREGDLKKGNLEKLMKDELKKKTDDEVRRAANNYKRSIEEIYRASQLRFDTEAQILSRLHSAGVGLDSKVWIIVNGRAAAQDIEKRDNFFTTTLPGELREGLKGTSEEEALLGAWSVLHHGSEPPPPVVAEFNRKLETNPAAAIEYLAKAEPKANRREEIELMAASRLTMEDKLSTAFNFIGKMKHDNIADVVDRENCYRLVASLASQKGQAEEVWKQVANVRENTEKVALCRGIIAGLLSSK